ncbi:hypothetical protein SDC9_210009 [bioreactor metagenome]|uniref:Uncharacterized protein n=1 Tax=bioreactor metagenome TaxID=1076179 RepID=A0A645JGC3_9ZZZZ
MGSIKGVTVIHQTIHLRIQRIEIVLIRTTPEIGICKGAYVGKVEIVFGGRAEGNFRQ